MQNGTDHEEDLPQGWWIFVTIYYFFCEFLVSFVVVLILRKPQHTSEAQPVAQARLDKTNPCQ